MKKEISRIADAIASIIETEEPILVSLSDTVISERRNSQNRTVKQIVGHLVDSASNNQQRMVRLQYCNGELSFPDYRQDNDLWICLQDYQHADWHSLVELWRHYNLHIVRIIRAADTAKMSNFWYDYEGNKVTLEQMIYGYLDHLRLHISEIHELVSLDDTQQPADSQAAGQKSETAAAEEENDYSLAYALCFGPLVCMCLCYVFGLDPVDGLIYGPLAGLAVFGVMKTIWKQ